MLRAAERPVLYIAGVLGLVALGSATLVGLLTEGFRVGLWPAVGFSVPTVSLAFMLYLLHVSLNRAAALSQERRKSEDTVKSVSEQLSAVGKAAAENEQRHREEEASLRKSISEANAATTRAEEGRQHALSETESKVAEVRAMGARAVEEERVRGAKVIEDERAAHKGAVLGLLGQQKALEEQLTKQKEEGERRLTDTQHRAEERRLAEVADRDRQVANLTAQLDQANRAILAERQSTQRAASAPIIEPYYRPNKPLLGQLQHFIGVRNRGAGPAENVRLAVSFHSPNGAMLHLTNPPFWPVIVATEQMERNITDAVNGTNANALTLEVTFNDIYGQQKTKSVNYPL